MLKMNTLLLVYVKNESEGVVARDETLGEVSEPSLVQAICEMAGVVRYRSRFRCPDPSMQGRNGIFKIKEKRSTKEQCEEASRTLGFCLRTRLASCA